MNPNDRQSVRQTLLVKLCRVKYYQCVVHNIIWDFFLNFLNFADGWLFFLAPWSRVLLHKLTLLFKNFPGSYKNLNHVYRSPPRVTILNEVNQVHGRPSYFRKINFNIFLKSTPRSSEWPLSFTLINKTFLYISRNPPFPKYSQL